MDVMFSRCSAPPVWWTAFWGSREGNAGRAARPRAARPRAACPRGACPPCLFIRTPAEGAPATLSLGHRQTAACARAGTGPCLVLKDQLAWSPWERQRVSQRGAGGLGLIPLDRSGASISPYHVYASAQNRPNLHPQTHPSFYSLPQVALLLKNVPHYNAFWAGHPARRRPKRAQHSFAGLLLLPALGHLSVSSFK